MSKEELAKVYKQIREHPAHRLYLDIEAFFRSMEHVFGANSVELLLLLDQAASDTRLALELVQNAYDDPVRREFNARLDQRLHNYLAATQSLVDHSRRLLDKLGSGEVHTEFATRLATAQEGDLMPFMIDLRNYTQHRILPTTGVTTRFSTKGASARILLNVAPLRRWKKWSPAAKRWLAAQPDDIDLRTILVDHHERVWALNDRLRVMVATANEAGQEEVNELIAEAQRLRMRPGTTIEQAKAAMDENEARLSQPRPPKEP